MYREIEIDGKMIPFLASAATPYRFKQVFKADLMKLLNGINTGKEDEAESINIVAELAYIMNAQAEKSDINKLSFETFLMWAEQFGPMSLVDCAKDIVDVYMGNASTSSSSKKKNG